VGLRETDGRFSDPAELSDEIRRRCTLHAMAELIVDRNALGGVGEGGGEGGGKSLPTVSRANRTAWEYKHTVNSSIDELNALGAVGWELVGCSIEGNGNKNFYLKRAK
jgi:hypothetical protein